jgi:proteic killer suppression protein
MAIQGFKTADLESIQNGTKPGKGFPADLIRIAQRKLAMLHAANVLDDLKYPPGNRLHALKDDRAGQHAISVNDQFRICFVWTSAGPDEVEFTDYH